MHRSDGPVRRSVLVVGLVGLAIFGGAVLSAGQATAGPAVSHQSAAVGSIPPTLGLDGAAPAHAQPNGTAGVCVVVFESPGCPACQELRSHLDATAADHNLRVVSYIAGDQPEHYSAYLRAYDVPERAWGSVPIVFVGNRYAVGSEDSIALIDRTVETTDELACPTLESTAGGGGIASVDRSTVLTLLGLAIGDAVNPCALAVLVILLTTVLSRENDQLAVLQAGVAFALAVATTYLLLGVLLVFGLKTIASVATLQTLALRQLFGFFAVAVGLLTAVDAVTDRLDGVPSAVPTSWRPAMQRTLTRPLWSRRHVIGGAAIGGVGVSLFLLPCTAGPYLVAGGILTSVPWGAAVPLLVLYNFVFVVPMLGVTLLLYGGFASAEAIGDWRERHEDALRLLAGAVLVVLGILLAAGSL